jgi:hypothetical protein
MMEELSMHILDLIQNSIMAGADRIEFHMRIEPEEDRLSFCIEDNGCGMGEEEVKNCLDPFYSSRGKKVGLGIPLLKLTAEQCGGGLRIESRKGEGTKILCWMELFHIDRPPVGDLPGTLLAVMTSYPELNFVFSIEAGDEKFEISSRQLKEELGDVPINHPEVIAFLKKILYGEINRILKKNKVI